MIAPSETHLEDWIVGNLPLFGSYYEFDEASGISQFVRRLIARQLRLPSGRADLVGLTHIALPSVTIIEIKRDEINEKTVAQCLRYMRDLQDIFFHTQHEWSMGRADRAYDAESVVYCRNGWLPEISGMVVGHRLANENVAIACEACGILPVVYDFNDGGYTFAREEVNHAPIAICYEFSMGAVGDAIREVLQTRIDYKKRFEDESAKSAQEER